MWNAVSLVQDLNSYHCAISYDDNHYTTGTSYIYIYFQSNIEQIQLYGHLPPITKTINVIRTRYAEHW